MTPPTSVLIFDHEPAVPDLMSRWVASPGLRPQTASNADEALTAYTELADFLIKPFQRERFALAADRGRR